MKNLMKPVLLALGLLTASTLTSTAFASDRTEYDGENCRQKGSDELRCLVCAIWTEDKGTVDGMEAVASVVFARMHSSQYPDSVCGVVYQPGQFTGVRGGGSRLPSNSQKLNDVVTVAKQLNRRQRPGPYLGFRAPSGGNNNRCKRGAVQIGQRGNCYQKSGEVDFDLDPEIEDQIDPLFGIEAA